MKKWANKERGLKNYCEGKDVYGTPFHIQDTSHAAFDAVWIYHGEEGENNALAVNKEGAEKIIAGLKKFLLK